ncbi:carbohydrate sulfotransferase 8-like isoform X2 [Macrobrachium nipponense]|uniref:carbohydrate sulfotransferase 8-like isoform X2 n=1 Tax=Macrobrachium nipponense TaxID=159736 RepID=UPI0030C86ACF
MILKPKQSWVCGVSCGCAFLMVYTYCVLYSSYQWNTKVHQNYDYEGSIARILLKQHLFSDNVTRDEEEEEEEECSYSRRSLGRIEANDTGYVNVVEVRQTRPPPSSNTKKIWNSTASIYTNWRRKGVKLGLMTEEEYMTAKEVNRGRQMHMQRSCQKFSASTANVFLDIMTHSKGNFYKLDGTYFLPQSPYASSFQVDWADEVMFCWQYKVGSTAWNALFAHLLNQTRVIRAKTFYDMREIMAVKNASDMKKALKFYRFMIVRHPFERLLSAYRDRIEDTTHRSWQREFFGPQILAVTRPKLKESEMKTSGSLSVIPTFTEFVQYLLETHMDKYDPHWAPFWKHCAPCAVSYHAIGKRETQLQDERFILEESGLATKANLKILEENAHQGRGDTQKLMLKYFSTLNLSTLEKLYRRYEVDFYLFGYDVQLLLNELYPGRNVSFPSSFH